MARRRKEDGRVGSTSAGMVRRWGCFFSRGSPRGVPECETVPERCHPSGAVVDVSAVLLPHGCNGLNAAVQEGACDETPFEELCFPLSIWNWHFVVKMARKSFLWASEYGKNGRFLQTAEIFAQPFVTR